MDTPTLDSYETINMVSDANSTGTVTTNGLEGLAASAATSLVFTGSAAMTIAYDQHHETNKRRRECNDR